MADLADLIGVSRVYIGMVEGKERVPSMDVASRWCEHVPGISLGDFVPQRGVEDVKRDL